jgi:hypothetical protein
MQTRIHADDNNYPCSSSVQRVEVGRKLGITDNDPAPFSVLKGRIDAAILTRPVQRAELSVEHEQTLDVWLGRRNPFLEVFITVQVCLERGRILGEHKQAVGVILRLVTPLHACEKVLLARRPLDARAVRVELRLDAWEGVEFG